MGSRSGRTAPVVSSSPAAAWRSTTSLWICCGTCAASPHLPGATGARSDSASAGLCSTTSPRSSQGPRRSGSSGSVGASVDPPTDQRSVRASLAGFRRMFPDLADTPIEHTWAGNIDTTPDQAPVLGPIPDAPEGFFLATGLSGHGFALGPGSAKLMSELVMDDARRSTRTPSAIAGSRRATCLLCRSSGTDGRSPNPGTLIRVGPWHPAKPEREHTCDDSSESPRPSRASWLAPL